jgi:excinuclease UvrABC ATPase subunit
LRPLIFEKSIVSLPLPYNTIFLSKQEELVFSAKFSCVECGYSLTELEPRLFSFNNPVVFMLSA